MINFDSFYKTYPDFDWKFYLNLHKDLSAVFDTENQAVNHYISYGIKEKRIYNYNHIVQNNQYVQDLIDSLYEKQSLISQDTYQKFTILIRSNKRPKYFHKCYSSIIEQNYPSNNYKLIVACHNNQTYDYLIKYSNINILQLEPISILKNTDNPYPYNLYLNSLLGMVVDSWVIIIDDDDLFVNKYSLSTINYEINKLLSINFNTNFTLHWRVWRCDLLVGDDYYNSNRPDPNMSLCGFCFHSSTKKDLFFNSGRVSPSINKFCQDKNIYWSQYIITKIGQETELAGYGESEKYSHNIAR